MINSRTDTVSNYYTPTDPGLKAWNGRRIVQAFLGLMCFFFALIVGGYWFYGQVESAQKGTEQAWRGVAEQLAMRYRKIEKAVAAGVDKGSVPIESGEQFRLSVDAFSSSSAVGNQIDSAAKLEELLSVIDKSISIEDEALRSQWTQANAVADGLAKAVDQYNTSVRDQVAVRDGFIGRLLQVFIHLNEPSPFSLSSISTR